MWPCTRACSTSEVTTLAEFDNSARGPTGMSGRPHALQRSRALNMPLVLGPIRRRLWRRATASVRSSSSRPSSPASLKPAASRMAPFTPRWPQASMTSGVVAAAVQTIARSISPGASAIDGYAGSPRISRSRGLIGTMAPA
jgi:hypothetical protein